MLTQHIVYFCLFLNFRKTILCYVCILLGLFFTQYSIYIFKDFIYLPLERGERREKEGESNIN